MYGNCNTIEITAQYFLFFAQLCQNRVLDIALIMSSIINSNPILTYN